MDLEDSMCKQSCEDPDNIKPAECSDEAKEAGEKHCAVLKQMDGSFAVGFHC
jgi:hypothetical protein